MKLESGAVAILALLMSGCPEQGSGTYPSASDMETMARQTKEYDELLEAGKENQAKVEEQDARYDSILTKWEEQNKRLDSLLDRWERITTAVEEQHHRQDSDG